MSKVINSNYNDNNNNNNISMALFPVGNTGSKRLTNKIHAYVKISKI